MVRDAPHHEARHPELTADLDNGSSLHLDGGGAEALPQLFASCSIRDEHITRDNQAFDNPRHPIPLGGLDSRQPQFLGQPPGGNQKGLGRSDEQGVPFPSNGVSQPTPCEAVCREYTGVMLRNGSADDDVARQQRRINGDSTQA
jgi:hypothetical protein